MTPEEFYEDVDTRNKDGWDISPYNTAPFLTGARRLGLPTHNSKLMGYIKRQARRGHPYYQAAVQWFVLQRLRDENVHR